MSLSLQGASERSAFSARWKKDAPESKRAAVAELIKAKAQKLEYG